MGLQVNFKYTRNIFGHCKCQIMRPFPSRKIQAELLAKHSSLKFSHLKSLSIISRKQLTNV